MKLYNLFAIFMLLVFLSGCAQNNQVLDDNLESNTEKAIDSKTTAEVPTAKKDLKATLESAVDYSAEYNLIINGETSNVKMVYDLPRFVMSTSIPEGDLKMIFDGTGIITCSNMENEWSCFKMAAEKPESVKISEDITSGASKITESGTCSRASEKGTKYDIESEGATSTICYTSDGILLEMKTADSEMYATKVSRSVSDSEFTPPATPRDISSMIPGATPKN